MQDRYVGDIGDFAKYSLLRALSSGYTFGVSWYLFPDEGNNDGRHTGYLHAPEKWCRRDEKVFKVLKDIVCNNKRGVSEIEERGLLPNTVFYGSRLDFLGCSNSDREEWRKRWFERSLVRLKDCNLIFADPDNGLRKTEAFRPGQLLHAKRIPECEVQELSKTATGGRRPVVIYHHNSRYPGGHDKEVRVWQQRLGRSTCAIRWRHFSARTFFILNCTDELEDRAKLWCSEWESSKVSLTPRQ